MTIVLTRNDKNKVVNFTVQDAAGTAVNLSTVSTITFKMKALNSLTNKVARACVPVVAASGTCKVTLTAGDLDTAGNYAAELQLDYASGDIFTADLEDVFVKPDLVNA